MSWFRKKKTKPTRSRPYWMLWIKQGDDSVYLGSRDNTDAMASLMADLKRKPGEKVRLDFLLKQMKDGEFLETPLSLFSNSRLRVKRKVRHER